MIPMLGAAQLLRLSKAASVADKDINVVEVIADSLNNDGYL